jgi:uncharacterized protein (TIGR02391 family)
MGVRGLQTRIIEGSYARLQALWDSLLPVDGSFVQNHFYFDYCRVLKQLREGTTDQFSGFDFPNFAWESKDDSNYDIPRLAYESKLRQLISYLEAVHNASNRVIEIGSAFNLIRDDKLKSRCADLLSAGGHFDRVINQATLVLEERIREKVPDLMSDIGLALVGKAINGELAKTRIRFSDNSSEQEGFANLFRGLIGAFRNPSHHRFLEKVTREQALQICAFIDNMLAALETAEVATLE